jgi:hypothetical protein
VTLSPTEAGSAPGSNQTDRGVVRQAGVPSRAPPWRPSRRRGWGRLAWGGGSGRTSPALQSSSPKACTGSRVTPTPARAPLRGLRPSASPAPQRAATIWESAAEDPHDASILWECRLGMRCIEGQHCPLPRPIWLARGFVRQPGRTPMKMSSPAPTTRCDSKPIASSRSSQVVRAKIPSVCTSWYMLTSSTSRVTTT